MTKNSSIIHLANGRQKTHEETITASVMPKKTGIDQPGIEKQRFDYSRSPQLSTFQRKIAHKSLSLGKKWGQWASGDTAHATALRKP